MALAQHFTNPANALVVRLSDKLRERNKLNEIGYATVIAFIFLGAGFAVMSQLEAMQHHHVVYETDVSFELTAPPPEVAPARHVQAPAPIAAKHAAIESAPTAQMRLPAAADAAKAIASAPSQTREATVPAEQDKNGTTNALAVSTPAPLTAAAVGNTPAAAQAAMTPQPAPSKNSVQLTPDMTAIAGGDFGAQRMNTAVATAPKMGNIKPYKLDLIAKIYQKWHPPSAEMGNIVLEISIAHDGSVVGNKIIQSSGDAAVDNDLLSIIGSTQFAPLPEWYRGQKLTWKLDLRTTSG